MAEKRFEVVFKEGKLSSYKILVDNVTGVNYLLVSEGYGGGLTPLLDKDGNIIISEVGRRQY
ncbi:MAG: hypothetical protein GX947_09295 [Tissierellia bacterium]|nr:hypothetical protein [Tissierellia bacterium]